MVRRIAIIGATSAIAEQCARLWLQQTQKTQLILIGRDIERLTRISADLSLRYSDAAIEIKSVNFEHPKAIEALIDSLYTTDNVVDIALIAHGAMMSQTAGQSDLTHCAESLTINGVSPVLFAEGFARHMAILNHGQLAIIGSVAGDRGRQSNYIYGAAKGLINRYVEGLQHRFAGSSVFVTLIKPGPTDTPMTAALKNQGAHLAPVDKVAREIVAGIAARQAMIYTPKKWRVIMLIIRHLPSFIFNKLKI